MTQESSFGEFPSTADRLHPRHTCMRARTDLATRSRGGDGKAEEEIDGHCHKTSGIYEDEDGVGESALSSVSVRAEECASRTMTPAHDGDFALQVLSSEAVSLLIRLDRLRAHETHESTCEMARTAYTGRDDPV
eukprot:6209225-Pleurochrysis_carterae.AAC.4